MIACCFSASGRSLKRVISLLLSDVTVDCLLDLNEEKTLLKLAGRKGMMCFRTCSSRVLVVDGGDEG